ncbi:MAG: hypothetical protein WA880_10365, partial [Ornithinimicrobium sp.]
MPSRPSIALATSVEVADLDDEGQDLAAELRRRGAEATAAVWDDETIDWSAYDLVVVRSTWDYATRREQFLQWAARISAVTTLANDAATLSWNTDKRYLLDLAAGNVPIVPSTFIEPGQSPQHDLLDGEHVAKPSVSAGSKDTLRLGPHEADRSTAHVERILASGRTALIQPYVEGIDTDGETALLFIDGKFSHAVCKAAILRPGADLVDGLFAAEEITPREPSRAERDIADRALVAIPGDQIPLYARVDLLPSPAGPVLLELELAEPS